MKSNEVLTNFKDIAKYILYLPFEEQMYEINRIINYLINYKYQRLNVHHKFTFINDIKDFRKDLIKYHLQKIRDNPIIANNSKPLYKILSVK